MAAIGEGRGHLAGTGELQQAHQAPAGGLDLHGAIYPAAAPRSLDGARRG